MITAAVVTFHTSRKDLIRLIDCVLHSSIDKFFIIDNSTNDALRVWGIERSGFFNGREKWAKGFENQRV